MALEALQYLVNGTIAAPEQPVLRLGVVHKRRPVRVPSHRGCVANHHQTVPCAREGHVLPPKVGKEADVALGGGPHARKNDDLGLPALKAIDCRHHNRLRLVAQVALAPPLHPGQPLTLQCLPK